MNPSAERTVSVIIVTWNSAADIRRCLDSLAAEKGDLSLETMVIDNASKDATCEIVRQSSLTVTLVANSANLGYAHAVNQGLGRATGRYVLLLNPDTVVRDRSLERMVSYLERDARIGALGPQLVNEDGSIQPSCREFPTYSILLWECTGLSRLFPHHPVFGRWRMGCFDHRTTREVDQPMGARLLIQREVFEKIGLLDERFPLFFNDVDLCRRIKQGGFRIAFLSQARVMHRRGGSTSQSRVQAILASHRGMLRYLYQNDPSNLRFLKASAGASGLFLGALLRILIERINLLLAPKASDHPPR